MKVAINRCFGGFSLSHKAIMRYAELAGLELYGFVHQKGNYDRCEPYDGKGKAFVIHYSTKPTLNDEGKISEKDYWSKYRFDEERSDPLLIQVVEELGEEADGVHARLRIVEIPDDIEFEIDEYDGLESIHEKHRSWE